MQTLLVLLIAAFPIFNSADDSKTRAAVSMQTSSNGLQQDQLHSGRMPAIEFKSQKYCRAEADDFEFDVRFKIVSATAYFTGANFTTLQFRKINSNDLTPLKDLMSKCIPGTMVVFDDIKVLGPDNHVRSIQGVSYRLY